MSWGAGARRSSWWGSLRGSSVTPALSRLTAPGADAKATYESAYGFDRTWNAAMRLVRVDNGWKVTEKGRVRAGTCSSGVPAPLRAASVIAGVLHRVSSVGPRHGRGGERARSAPADAALPRAGDARRARVEDAARIRRPTRPQEGGATRGGTRCEHGLEAGHAAEPTTAQPTTTGGRTRRLRPCRRSASEPRRERLRERRPPCASSQQRNPIWCSISLNVVAGRERLAPRADRSPVAAFERADVRPSVLGGVDDHRPHCRRGRAPRTSWCTTSVSRSARAGRGARAPAPRSRGRRPSRGSARCTACRRCTRKSRACSRRRRDTEAFGVFARKRPLSVSVQRRLRRCLRTKPSPRSSWPSRWASRSPCWAIRSGPCRSACAPWA